jgi:ribosomal protein L32
MDDEQTKPCPRCGKWKISINAGCCYTCSNTGKFTSYTNISDDYRTIRNAPCRCKGDYTCISCAAIRLIENTKKGDNIGFGEPQAKKQDDGKPTPELLPFAALIEVSSVLMYGATKYRPHDWRKGLLWSRLLGAALRHLFAWGAGENKDPETGRSHLAHACCCVLFLLDYEMTGGYADLDDRAKGRPLC